MTQARIFHITDKTAWETAQTSQKYVHESLETEGFIHCSQIFQIEKVANLFFQDQSDLVLLEIDPQRLQAVLNYDEIEGGEKFPHLYGPLNLDAVVKVWNFPCEESGNFKLPQGLG